VQGFRGLDSEVGVLQWEHCFGDGGVEVEVEADDSVVSCCVDGVVLEAEGEDGCVAFWAVDAASGSLCIEGDVREGD
jgi:hypothetical protein